MSNPIHVLHVCSEVAPFAKTGGLADVCAALPRALSRRKLRQTVVLPRYRGIDPRKHMLARRLDPILVPLGQTAESVTLYEGHLPGAPVPVYLVDHPLYDRDGLYGDANGDYPDNGRRFALVAAAALELCHRLGRWPDVVHAHDWQAGLAPLLSPRVAARHGRPAPRTVLTIHNLAFQGLAPKSLVEELGLGWDIWHPDGAEFYDQLSFLKAGIAYADAITTVSPRYAREIQTPAQGAGLEGFLRARAHKLQGILNGIDTDVWDPAHDPHLPVPYDAEDRTGKASCKSALQRELSLPVRAHVPLYGSISRLTEQKGFDLVAQAGEELARLDAQLVFLGGAGEKRFEDALVTLARRFPSKVAVRLGYDDRLAHRIEAAADFFLMPSRFEPCGLNQLYSFRYGAIPIVRATGGLDDTVIDYDEITETGTGFKFEEYTPAALVHAVKRAFALTKRPQAMSAVVERIMRLDHGWEQSAARYADLYRQLVGATEPAVA